MGLLTLIRDDLVFPKTWEEYSPPLERFTVMIYVAAKHGGSQNPAED